ncbi:hypothetical protein ACLOJK_007190, partial [Asimina triloba]
SLVEKMSTKLGAPAFEMRIRPLVGCGTRGGAGAVPVPAARHCGPFGRRTGGGALHCRSMGESRTLDWVLKEEVANSMATKGTGSSWLAAMIEGWLRPHRIWNELDALGIMDGADGPTEVWRRWGCRREGRGHQLRRGGGNLTVVEWNLPEMDGGVDDIILRGSIGPHCEAHRRQPLPTFNGDSGAPYMVLRWYTAFCTHAMLIYT